MKLKNKFKAKQREQKESRDNDSGRPSWMITNPDRQQAAMREAQALAGKNRPPEFWLKDGEEKIIRVRHEGPVSCLWCYSAQIRGKWRRFTVPPEGEVDLFRDELALQPMLRGIYEIIDVKGYVDQQGKKHRNVSRFFNCSNKQTQQLEKLRKKLGPLNRFDIEVSREGSGPKTTYMFLPQPPSPMTPEMKAAPSLKPDFAKFYAPLSESEQRAIVGRSVPRHDNDEVEDDD